MNRRLNRRFVTGSTFRLIDRRDVLRGPFRILLAALSIGFVSSADSRAETGVHSDRIVLGQSAAFNGPAASLGTAFRDGLNAAFKAVNRSGGIHGRHIRLIGYDDGYEPEQAIANTKKLIDDDAVFALIGEVGTPTSRAAHPLSEKAGIPFVAPFTGASFLRDPALITAINLRASYAQEAEALIGYLTGSEHMSRIAVLYQDDTFGRVGLNGVREALKRRDMAPVSEETFRRNTTAVKRALLSIRRSQPEAVIIVGPYEPAAVFIKTAAQIGFEPTFAALSFVGSKALAAELHPNDHAVVVSQVVPLFDDRTLPLAKNFLDALTAANPQAEAGFVTLEGYIAGRLVAEALRRLGPQPTRSAFLDLFKSPATFDIDGMVLEFGPGDNQGSDRVFLTAIGEDGSFVALDAGL
ncbi:ABC transporter substrate-binding protein [Hoeflea prorocentri]|uniref:ABC transporter substrate-binding protein n=1 Tax=Hoeflea prorocentri TaxID=1922333 RepID=A0A9X3UKX6_9HYPH|nr:ABC transporter substrate-binding protein [Hoeflea prorocentri]MCY6382466.1 ABC transporter substrate-binding protein [Hoeflea prorocentri]MDA5400266.1 ABC transporter substrate-binding protein [Hoeflea prorocentri]